MSIDILFVQLRLDSCFHTRPDIKPFRDRVVGYQDEWAKKINFMEMLAAIRPTQ